MINQRSKFGSHLGLERITKVCELLGKPQESLPAIHLAGTNGKGSVAKFLATVLQQAGFRVGLYTSPHLMDYRERLQVNGEPISDEHLNELTRHLEPIVERVEQENPALGPVTEFEVGTALAFQYFVQAKVDIAIIETGLGGRLDATNVVRPLVCGITPIGHDHMDWLGPTLSHIAKEKAGIFKPGVPIVSAWQHPEAKEVLTTKAQETAAPIYFIDEANWQPLGFDLLGGTLMYPNLASAKIRLRMLGGHQLENAALALRILEVLQTQGWKLPEQAVLRGMHRAIWPGRMEIISQRPWMLLDGAHNQEGIIQLAANLKALFSKDHKRRFTFVFGLLENKDISLMDPLLPLARQIIFTQPASSRIPAKDPCELRHYALEKKTPAYACKTVPEALEEAVNHDYLVVCGSLYLVGEIRKMVVANKGF